MTTTVDRTTGMRLALRDREPHFVRFEGPSRLGPLTVGASAALDPAYRLMLWTTEWLNFRREGDTVPLRIPILAEWSGSWKMYVGLTTLTSSLFSAYKLYTALSGSAGDDPLRSSVANARELHQWELGPLASLVSGDDGTVTLWLRLDRTPDAHGRPQEKLGFSISDDQTLVRATLEPGDAVDTGPVRAVTAD